MEVNLTYVGLYQADGSYVIFRRLALANENYLIFFSSRRKLFEPMKVSIFLVMSVVGSPTTLRHRHHHPHLCGTAGVHGHHQIRGHSVHINVI
jgi:hypothetical protein